MNPYPRDPLYGQPQPPVNPYPHDPIYAARRRMQGWWGAFVVTFLLGLILSAAYSASLTPSTNPYIHTPQPTSLTYVLLAIGLVNGVLGTVSFVVAIRATRDHRLTKQSMYGGF